MTLHLIDWIIIGAYLLFSLAVGVFYAKRASQNAEEYYLAGRTLPWWVLGTSMVATTFAADTPLAITEYLRQDGIWKNWFWWNWLLSGLLSVFLFSRLWRRAGVLTDNEILELRYRGKPAAFLRGYKAIHFGIIFNLIVMGWVMESMSTVLAVTANVDKTVALWVLAGIALFYSLLSGFWGVVVTDVVQFFIAMVGAIILAVLAVSHVGGMGSLLEKIDGFARERAPLVEQMKVLDNAAIKDTAAIESLTAQLKTIPPVSDQTLSLFPSPLKDANLQEFLLSPFFYVLVLVIFMPWNHHGTDGSGYIIQRMMAAKNEKHALMGTLWYNLANYALRAWPWIIVAMVSLVLHADLTNYKVGDVLVGDKAGYPLIMQDVLGPGLLGVLVVSFLAAFMSTIDTHVNWGSSYLMNDVYLRFINPKCSERQSVLVGRVITVALMVTAALLSTQMQGIGKAWDFVWAMGAGIGMVLILRWFWWRVNAWSEITALATSFVITVAFQLLAYYQATSAGTEYKLFETLPVIFGLQIPFHLQLLFLVPVCAIAWITVTLLTPPESIETLQKFYDRVQPGGLWGAVERKPEHTLEPVSKGIIGHFIAGVMFIYGATFSIGYFILQQWGLATGLLVVSLIGFWWIWTRCLKGIHS